MRKEAGGSGREGNGAGKLVTFLTGNSPDRFSFACGSRPVIGVIEGTGIGPQVIAATLRVLASLEEAIGVKFEIWHGGPIGEEAEALFGQSLPDSVVQFCQEVFDRDGAILNGPGGGRYVYDLRLRLDLFCKFVPVRPWPQLAGAGRIVRQGLENVDLLFVRDKVGGVYQGQWREWTADEGRVVEHSFGYAEGQVRRLVEVATGGSLDLRRGHGRTHAS